MATWSTSCWSLVSGWMAVLRYDMSAWSGGVFWCKDETRRTYSTTRWLGANSSSANLHQHNTSVKVTTVKVTGDKVKVNVKDISSRTRDEHTRWHVDWEPAAAQQTFTRTTPVKVTTVKVKVKVKDTSSRTRDEHTRRHVDWEPAAAQQTFTSTTPQSRSRQSRSRSRT